MRRFISVFMSCVFLQLVLSGCLANYHIAGYFDDYNELFIGENKIGATGEADITLVGEKTGIVCKGSAWATAGRSGNSAFTCDDGRRMDGRYRWTTNSIADCYAVDQYGNRFTYIVGTSRDEIKGFIARARKRGTNLPDLPEDPTLPSPKSSAPRATTPELEKSPEVSKSSGTGFLVTSNGHIVTNHHVVERASEITATVNGRTYSAKLVSQDPDNDLALLQISASTSHLPIAEFFNLRKGDQVVALGYPLVNLQGSELKATFGRVNSVSGIQGDVRYFQIDAPVQPGNSGGPLLDSNGKVVGVVSAMLDQMTALSSSGVIPQNVNYAIKIDYVLPMLRRHLSYPDSTVLDSSSLSSIVSAAEPSLVHVVATR